MARRKGDTKLTPGEWQRVLDMSLNMVPVKVQAAAINRTVACVCRMRAVLASEGRLKREHFRGNAPSELAGLTTETSEERKVFADEYRGDAASAASTADSMQAAEFRNANSENSQCETHDSAMRIQKHRECRGETFASDFCAKKPKNFSREEVFENEKEKTEPDAGGEFCFEKSDENCGSARDASFVQTGEFRNANCEVSQCEVGNSALQVGEIRNAPLPSSPLIFNQQTSSVEKSPGHDRRADFAAREIELTDLFLSTAKKLAESINAMTPTMLDRTSLSQRAVAMGILADKYRLFSGKSTSNVASIVNIIRSITPKRRKGSEEDHKK